MRLRSHLAQTLVFLALIAPRAKPCATRTWCSAPKIPNAIGSIIAVTALLLTHIDTAAVTAAKGAPGREGALKIVEEGFKSDSANAQLLLYAGHWALGAAQKLETAARTLCATLRATGWAWSG